MRSANGKWIHVTGASGELVEEERLAASHIGTMLASQGYGLIIGDWPGVDEIVATSFLEALPEAEQAARIKHVDNYARGHARRVEGAEVLSGIGNDATYSTMAVQHADAGIVVSGRAGSKPAMDALLRLGKPVLPVAFLGYDAFELFREVLSFWHERPVKGLSERQFLELVRPWRFDTRNIARLLTASLTESAHIFISYRRTDVPAAAGRIYDELSHAYGNRSVFIDHDHLLGGQDIERIITCVQDCEVFVGIIGPGWETRGFAEGDFIRREYEAARAAGLRIIPVLLLRTALPAADVLPESMRFLLDLNFVTIFLDEWSGGVGKLRKAVDSVLFD